MKKNLEMPSGERFSIDNKIEKPIGIISPTGNIGGIMLSHAIREKLFQAIFVIGRSSRKKTLEERIYKNIHEVGGGEFDEYLDSHNSDTQIISPIEIDVTKDNIGIDEETTNILKEASNHCPGGTVLFDTMADIKFMPFNAPEDQVAMLDAVDHLGPINCYNFAQRINAVLAHVNTFFSELPPNGIYGSYYEFAKSKALRDLQDMGAENVVCLRPPVVASQGENGFNPWHGKIDGISLVQKVYLNQFYLENSISLDMDKDVGISVVKSDELAKLMLDLTMQYVDNRERALKIIDCTSGEKKLITAQDTIDVLIDAYEIINTDAQIPKDFIQSVRNAETVYIPAIEGALACCARWSAKRDYGEGFPDIGVDRNELFKMTLAHLIKGFRNNGKIKLSKEGLIDKGVLEILGEDFFAKNLQK